ncbi:MAG: hypothetical protein VKN72_13465 [Nostocales cyanobacterium 94392]|nr:hypothetical protein [Nostocales cyanobacterium 94392]
MSELFLDWIWLYIQFALLGILIVREIIRRRNRNLYAILIPLTMLFLVQGQAWWILEQFQNQSSQTLRHLYQYIDLDSTRLANLYAGLCVISLVITNSWIKRHKSKKSLLGKSPPVKLRVNDANTFTSYILIAAWLIVFSGMLIILLGGLQAAINKPGQIVGGQTFLLIAVSVGKIPLQHKITFQQRVNKLDLLLFGITFLVTLLNSRFLSTFILAELVLLFNYCYKQISRRWMLGGAFVLILIFVVFGFYRDNASLNVGLSFSERLELLSDRFNDDDESPLDWIYRTNVEGFVGLAGILTYESAEGGIIHDFGLSNLLLFMQLLPNAIRNNSDLVAPLFDFIKSLYPYSGSVVPPGLEAIYVHFGLPGILFLGVLLGYLMNLLHEKMLDPNEDRLGVALLSSQSINIVRTTFSKVLFFCLGDLTALFLYRVIRTFGNKVEK